MFKDCNRVLRLLFIYFTFLKAKDTYHSWRSPSLKWTIVRISSSLMLPLTLTHGIEIGYYSLKDKKINFEDKRSNLFQKVFHTFYPTFSLLIAHEQREEKFGQAKSCFAAIQKICKQI